jgi:hypothetical protein
MMSFNRISFSRLAPIALLTGVLLTIALALLITQLVAAADEALNVRSRYDGTYGIASGGVGFELIAPGGGDIVLDVPGPPVQAFLFWAGQDTDPPGGDDSVLLSVNSGPTNPITALRSYGPEFWNDPPTRNSHVWVADVTSLVLQGTNTYTVSDFGPMYAEFGAGLVVVYQDGGLPYSFAEIVEGLDGAYYNYGPPRGPDTEVSCIQFSATASDRTMNLSFFVGGVNISGGLRPDALWYQTGTGSLPTDLVNQPGATEIGGQPFNSRDGEEWDTYQDSITVPAGDTYACFQIESIADQPPLGGSSLLWVNLSVSMAQDAPTNTPTPTSTFTPTPTNTNTPTPTNTFTPTPTNTFTPTPTNTSPAATDTPTPTPADTSTPTSTSTSPPGATSTFTPVPSNTPSSTPGNTLTPAPTTQPSPSPTASSSTLPESGMGGEFGLPTLIAMGLTTSAIVFLARYLRK